MTYFTTNILTYFTTFSIVDFEQINVSWEGTLSVDQIKTVYSRKSKETKKTSQWDQ